MTQVDVEVHSSPEPLERPINKIAVPEEGSDGLFTQSWFPICLSSDVPVGKVISRGFLDGEVIVFRGEDGVVRVHSAYCLHMGAHLGGGDVIGNEIRCPFHHWSYDGVGQCLRTGVGDPPPARAKLFAFPTEEHCGIVFAFNGETPLYPFPNIFKGVSEDDLIIETYEDPRPPWPLDPWAIRGNTPDWAHFACVHHMTIDPEDIPDPKTSYDWDKYSVRFDAPVTRKTPEGGEVKLVYKAQITGTTLWHNTGTFNGRWHMLLSALGIPKAGTSSHFYVTAAHKGSTVEEEAEARAFVKEIYQMWEEMLDEDDAILQTQRYKPGLFTKADGAVARFLQFVKGYPRAHPSRNFLR